MNVSDYIDERLPGELEHPTAEAWEMLLEMRRDTFLGFLRVEEVNGGMSPNVSLSSKAGQESVRMLFARTFEEYFEAHSSGTREHFLEELIDCINYAMSVLFLEDRRETIPQISGQLEEAFMNYMEWKEAHGSGWVNLWHFDLLDGSEQVDGEAQSVWGAKLIDLAEESDLMLATLRNRAWQHSVQSPYFDGWPQVMSWVVTVVATAFILFDANWDEFVTLYVAKDKVLQFRLRSNY